MDRYTDEKVPLVEVETQTLPVPATYTIERTRPSFIARLLRFTLVFFATFFILDIATQGVARYAKVASGCGRAIHRFDGGHDQKPLPPHHKWHPYKGTTHFELEPVDATGLSVTGAKAFGKVVFETSKLSEKIIIDLNIKTNHHATHDDVSVEEKDGYITVNTPSTGDLETYASARIQIPSNIIGKFGLPKFDVNVPKHMIDYSSLPESLEIGVFALRAAKGFVKTGPVHTNTTQITVAKGAVKGSVTQARWETSVDVARGNVTLSISGISSGDESTSNIKLGDGHLRGSYPVYNSTTLDVVKGSINVSVHFESSEDAHRGELSTKVGSGPARVYIDSIAAERLIESYHTTINGDQVITYPQNFQGTIDARGIAGDIKLEGKDLAVEKVLGGLQGKKGDSERNYISVKAAKGDLDILIGEDEE